MHITFICTGNTCRSPMAEGIARNIIAQEYPDSGVTVSSAGTGAFGGDAASQHSIDVCREIGVDISGHRSQCLNPEILEKTDLFAVMTGNHAAFLRRCGVPSDHIAVLGNIPDPYGGSEEIYRRCRDRIYTEVQKLLRRVIGEPKQDASNPLPEIVWEEKPDDGANESSE